jgi:DNA polymerase-4
MSELDVLHLDMDCFFAAVEVRDDPSLAGKPLIVGGTGGRGVVASASYEARAFGVHSAMPTAEARRLCPHGIYMNGNHSKYRDASRALMAMLQEVTPHVEALSLDEAFLDVSGAHQLLGESIEIARALRSRVHDELGLECSVGVGRTKLIAKLASKAAKPRVDPVARTISAGPGVVAIGHDEEEAFLHALPVRALPGAGPRTCERLARLGVTSVGELASIGRERLIHLLGKSQGGTLHDLAHGIDPRPVVREHALRSIGHEQTYPKDDRDPASLERKISEIAQSLAQRLREGGHVGRTVSLKLKFADFSLISRSHTLTKPINSATILAKVGHELLNEIDVGKGVRLVGLQVSNFAGADEVTSEQLSLFGGDESPGIGEQLERYEQLESTTDAIRRRFGDGALSSLYLGALGDGGEQRRGEH